MALDDRTPHPAENAGSIPRHGDGTINLARIAASLSLELHPIGSSIVACATYLAFLDEITPRRGEQRDLLDQLAASLTRVHETYCDADDRLVHVAVLLDLETPSTPA